jgi:hypothetical protein
LRNIKLGHCCQGLAMLTEMNRQGYILTNLHIYQEGEVYVCQVNLETPHGSLQIPFRGSVTDFLVCVRGVIASMAQGGTPYGSH